MTLKADWDAPPGITAFTTTRTGGHSRPPYDGFNLALHVGDDEGLVRSNRRELAEAQGWDREPLWLNQVHGRDIVRAEEVAEGLVPRADGAVTASRRPLVVLTADCLPVVACDRGATVVGAFHAGWKGLLAGVLEAGIAALGRPAAEILVWIGPAIGPQSYQVGPEVREAFLASNPDHTADFVDDGPGHWRFDLAGAAVRRLSRLGVPRVGSSAFDTFGDQDRFFSHRRQAPCGRMATVIVKNVV